MTQTPDFADWLAICNLKAAYCRLLDTKDWEGWRQLFTEDCVVDTRPSGGTLEEGRDGFVDMVALTGYGHYHETCVRTADGWKIAHQTLTRLIVEMDGKPA